MSGVEIRVRSDSRQARSDLRNLEKSVTNIEKSASGVATTFKRLAVGIATAFTGTALTKSINGATDSLTSLENRIALVTGRGAELNVQLDALFRIAKETKSPIDATVETFNRFARSLKAAGKTTTEINQAVRSVGLATTISGGSAESTRAALFQLGQGLASGQLRGQELNSVLEQAPRLARVISDSLQVPFGSLRKLAEQGRITTEVVFEALINQTSALEGEFENIAITSDKAFSILKDQIGRVTGEVSQQLGITEAFTSRIVRLTDFIELNRSSIVSNIVNSGRNLTETFQGVIAVFRGIARIVEAIFGRALDAIPNLTSPMRDFVNEVSVKLVGSLLFARAVLRRFGLDIESVFDKLFNTRFQGAIRDIFRSRSIKDFGDALFNVGVALDSYGRRWYNFRNFAERALRTTNVFLFETGVFLGIIDQTLFRLRFTSFERFTKVFGVLGNILSELRRNILATDFLVALQVQIVKAEQFTIQFARAIDNLTGNRISEAFGNIVDLFRDIYNAAFLNLNRTLNVIDAFAVTTKNIFADIYDKVIGNSFWTDTMEATYDKARQWLPRTIEFIKSFGTQISNVYQQIQGILSNDFSSANQIQLRLDKFKINAKAKVEAGNELAGSVIEAIGRGAKNALEALTALSPQLAAFISLGVTAALTSLVSPSFFNKTFGKLTPLFAVALAVSAATAFDNALLKSGLLEQVASGMGSAIGAGINTIVKNIPQILKLLIRVANEFGKGLADAIGNSIVGLPAQILTLLPGGGILATIFYGGLVSAVFFKGIRTQIFGFISQLAAKIGAAQGSGLIYNLFVGSNPANLTKGIKGKVTEGAKAAAATAAQANRRAGLAQLGSIAGFVVGAELLLGDLIGTTGAAIVGIGASIAQRAILGDPAKVNLIVNKFNGILATILAKITSLDIFTKAQALSSAFLTGLTTRFSGALGNITKVNTATTANFAARWKASTAAATASITKFQFASAKKLGKIALLAAGVTAAFATMASASEDGESSTSATVMGALGFGLLAFGDTILQFALPALGKLGKLLGTVGKIGAKSLGRVALAGALKLAAGIGAIAGGIPLITGAFLAAAATIISASVGGIIYSAFFGEGDGFLDRVRNNFNSVLAYFNLLNVSLTETRKQSLKTLENIEKLIGKEFSIKLSAKLDSVDLSQASDRQLLAIEKAVNNLDKNRKIADGEVSAFGRVTENTREAIRSAVTDVEDAIKAGSGEGSPTATVAKELQKTFIKVLDAQDSVAFRRLFSSSESDINIANALKEFLKSDQFNQNNAFENPAVVRAFADQIMFALPNSTREAVPPEILGLLNSLSIEGIISSGVADSFMGIRAVEAGILDKILNDSDLSIPQVQLDVFRRELEEANKARSARFFMGRTNDVVKTIEASIGRELSFGERSNITGKRLTSLEGIVADLEKAGQELKFDPKSTKDIEAILKLAQSTDATNELTEKAKDVAALRKHIQHIVEDDLRFSIDPGTINDLNSQLKDLGGDLLNESLGSVVQTFNQGSQFDNLQKVQRKIEEINTLIRDRNNLTLQDDISNAELVQYQNRYAAAIAFQKQQLKDYVGILNSRSNEENNWVNLIEQATGLISNRDITLNDLLRLDQNTLETVAKAQGALNSLNLEMTNLGTLSIGTDQGGGRTAQVIQEEINAAIKIIQMALANAGKVSGVGSGETLFEKFVGKLSDSGFAFDLSTASALGSKAILALQAPLKAIEDAQKRIVNLTLHDSRGRKAAIDLIKEQRKEIFKVLTQDGSVGSARIGLEAMGLDPALIDASKQAQRISFDILNTQDRINSTSAADLETRHALNMQLERQQALLKGITEDAEAATANMQNALSSGLKALLKGENDIKDFFKGLMDSISSQIIDTVVESFVQAFFRASQLDTMFDQLFSGLFSQGESIGTTYGKTIGENVTKSLEASTANGGSWLQNLFSGVSGFGSGLFNAIMGIGGGGGFFSSLFGFNFGSIFGLNSGGIVPNTPYSRIGQDSVPAMLTPGELVVPANKVKSFVGSGSGQTVVNLSITGDISRQTRQEVIKMLPTIASGVNSQNRERNFKYR